MNQEETTISYSNIVFSYFLNSNTVCRHKAIAHTHMLVYVCSGQMTIVEKKQTIRIEAGECIFVKRDHTGIINKGPFKGKQYRGILLKFDRDFLRDYYRSFNKKNIPLDAKILTASVFKLAKSANIDSIFYSMVPYFNADNKPNDELMQLKLQEGLISLLDIDKDFYPTLFDFTSAWKIDILDFMNKNYMSDFSIDEIALYTGRSLASFKRDFNKISNLSPQKWIIQKRLAVAYDRIKNKGEKIADVCFDVGFKNRSHFTTAFKKQFGFAPTHFVNNQFELEPYIIS